MYSRTCQQRPANYQSRHLTNINSVWSHTILLLTLYEITSLQESDWLWIGQYHSIFQVQVTLSVKGEVLSRDLDDACQVSVKLEHQ